MSTERVYSLYLDDILESISRIEEYTKSLTFEEFQQKRMAIDGVVRNLERIGEAVKNIPDKLKDNYPEVEWKEAIGF